ncbi:MAG: MATE family efflux transporter, partial [Lachnospiraceae bacterium]|nr:MATE family efflux transporter [Lachnospiraceae bacterium]
MNQNSNSYLAEEPIGKLMMKFSVPCIMSLLVSSLYNIVDQIFIGRGVGYLGNGATNVVFPITVIALALALMIGDGCAAFLSICQGKRDTEGTKKGVGNGITMLVIGSIILM